MMSILFDTNVVLDVLIARDPYAQEAMALFEYIEQDRIRGLITSTTVTTVYYVGRKAVGERLIRARIQISSTYSPLHLFMNRRYSQHCK